MPTCKLLLFLVAVFEVVNIHLVHFNNKNFKEYNFVDVMFNNKNSTAAVHHRTNLQTFVIPGSWQFEYTSIEVRKEKKS